MWTSTEMIYILSIQTGCNVHISLLELCFAESNLGGGGMGEMDKLEFTRDVSSPFFLPCATSCMELSW